MQRARVQRSAARRLFMTTANKLRQHLAEEERITIEAEFDTLGDRFKSLREIDNEILSLWLDDPNRDEAEFEADINSFEDYEETWYILKQRVKVYLEAANAEIFTKIPCKHDNDSSISKRNRHLCLPKLELPKFDGEISKWLAFWAQFNKIDSDESLDNDEKFHYLLQCMEHGSNARELVESFPPTGTNYDKVIKQLKERFGREELIIEHYVRQLLQLVLAQTKGTAKPSLRALYDKLMTQILALESLGVTQDKYTAFLYPLIESALPEEILRAWSRSHVSTNVKNGTPLTELLDFVKKEVEAEERIRLSRSSYDTPSTSAPTAAFFSSSFKKDKRQNAEVVPSQDGRPKYIPTCLWCDKTSHSSSECRVAMNKNLEERKEFIKAKNACSICLIKGHMWKKCKKHPKCLICGRRHFTIMCESLAKEQNEQNNTSAIAKDQNIVNQIAAPSSFTKTVLLQTLRVKIINGGKELEVRALLDSGAQRSFIKTDVIEKLQLKPTGTEELGHVLFGGAVTKKRKHNLFELNIQGLDGQYERKIEALEQETICGHLARIRKGSIISQLQNLGISITDCIDNDITEISLLIGSDVLGSLFTGRSVQIDENLLATETKLGWTIQGPALGVYCSVGNVDSLALNNASSFDVDDFWKLETIGIRDESEVKNQQKLDSEIAVFFKDTVRVNEEERYEVQLPWKDTAILLKPNYHLALKRLQSTTSKLTKLGILDDYNKVFEEWLENDIIEDVQNDDATCGHYLPHHAVIKESSLTTKLRPVFDASAKDKNNLSLNACLERGVNLIELIPRLLIQFRRNAIGVTADIKKAFLQISVNPRDRDYLKFLWWRDISEDEKVLKVFRHRRVVFGVTTSPFLLSATILHHLEQFQETHITTKLRNSFYVDNCVLSVKNEYEMQRFISEAKDLMIKGKFELRCWVTSPVITDKDILTTSVLGLEWDTQKDELFCKVPNVNIKLEGKITKRFILSAAQSVFDPIGFTCPTTIIPKLVIQKCWILNLEWDQEVPKDLEKLVRDWARYLECLKLCRIPRRISSADLDDSQNTLLVFSDASQTAYAACIFLRSEQRGNVDVHLVTAKSRVAPTKSITIPRLELVAALMATRLAAEVKNGLDLNFKEYYWTDSSIVLAWIKRKVGLNIFVHNRVNEIVNRTNVNDWHHIPGELNPADLPSRGCNPEVLLKSKWWEGPLWLRASQKEWPQSNSTPDEKEVQKKVKKSCLLEHVEQLLFSERLLYFSKYSKIVRVVGWLLRFADNCRLRRRQRRTGNISNEEFCSAEIRIFKMLQSECFDSAENLNSKFNIETFQDKDGLIRVKTRLTLCEDTYDFKCPILLQGKNVIVERLVVQKHVKELHAGSQTLISKLREHYWIIGIRRLAKMTVHKCIICRRYNAKPCSVPCAPLPVDRINCGSVFEVTGIDLAGPLLLKTGSKCWIVLFTCATYRAVHLEVCTSLSTEDFLMVLRRFIARRGNVRVIYSDNGTNLRGASNLLKGVNWTDISSRMTLNKISWRHIPPAAPWWGGFWERLIKVVKDTLRRVLGKAALLLNELGTALCEVEAMINSRPLTYIAANTENLTPLTPSMFMNIGSSSSSTAAEVFSLLNGAILSARWRYIIKLQEDLRQRFRSEYLALLCQKSSRYKGPGTLKIGDVVIIGSDNEKRRVNWPLGTILEIFEGKDGHTRVARVKTQTGVVDRPYQRLYPLEVSTEQCAS